MKKEKTMKAKKDIHALANCQFTFFESPLGNIERQPTLGKTINEAPMIYANKYYVPVCTSHYPTVDNGGMESTLLEFDDLKPGDTLDRKTYQRQQYTRNLDNDMELVNHYTMGANGGR